jgi:hypothetical protein
MNLEEFNKMVFDADYCNKEIYIVEAFFANPHKYPDSTRDEIYEHVQSCKRCTSVFIEAQEQHDAYEKMMRD